MSFVKKITLVVLCSLIMAVCLTAMTRDINFIITDAGWLYLPAANKLPALQYVSQLHTETEFPLWLHGKELSIVSFAAAQGIMNDHETLRPLIIVCIIALALSSVLIFCVSRKYWGDLAGSICYVVFMTSFWPYFYVLLVRHQPMGLFYFLLSILFLQVIKKDKGQNLFCFISGLCMCFSLHSSTVSAVYLPFYLAALVYSQYTIFGKDKGPAGFIKNFLQAGGVSLAGFGVAIICFNYPNIMENLESFLRYVRESTDESHFSLNQLVLRQWIENPEQPTRGGWLWIIKYFFLVMPVLFSFYILCVVYLFGKMVTCCDKRMSSWIKTAGIVFLSLSPLFLAEIKGVAQYGGNYFPFIVGILLVVGYVLRPLSFEGWWRKAPSVSKKMTGVFLTIVFVLHVAANGHAFFSDVYPSRMATTFLSEKIKQLGIKRLYVNSSNPLTGMILKYLNPELEGQVGLKHIDNIYLAKEGYVLVAPVAGTSIYNPVGVYYTDFDEDIFLNELIRKGNIQDYAVASFKTLASSRVWLQEEEIVTYKDLVLRHLSKKDFEKGRMWLLDAGKLQADIQNNMPSQEYQELVSEGIRNIGKKESLYKFKGDIIGIQESTSFADFNVRLYKVGDPKDQLIAYIYQRDHNKQCWVPASKNYASLPLGAQELTSDKKGEMVKFKFSEPMALEPGYYHIVVYRTGEVDDNNFYRIYIGGPEKRRYIQAARIM